MSDAIVAGLLAGLASSALLLGAVVGVVWRPSPRTVATVMAFGSGALIQAVVTQLAMHPATELVSVHGETPVTSWLIVAAGFLSGGLVFVGLNVLVERLGGGLHRPRRLRLRALEEKQARVAPILRALAGTDIAQRVVPEDAETILPHLREIAVPPGAVIYRPGDPSDTLYIVQQGKFEVRQPVADGTEHSTWLGPGDVVGGLGMIGGEPRTATLVAAEDGALLALSRADFDRVLARLPAFRMTVTDMVARQLFASAQERDRADPSEWYRSAVGSLQHLTRAEEASAARAAGAGSPFAIFIGTLQDGIPESLAIGASFTGLAAFNPTFLVAVWVSSLPEGISGTQALLKAGLSAPRIWLMWLGLLVGSAVAGSIGYAALRAASPAMVAAMGAFAGGGVVAMLATTMMPEAYETGRSGVVPATIAGLLASLLLSILELEVR